PECTVWSRHRGNRPVDQSDCRGPVGDSHSGLPGIQSTAGELVVSGNQFLRVAAGADCPDTTHFTTAVTSVDWHYVGIKKVRTPRETARFSEDDARLRGRAIDRTAAGNSRC